MKYSEELRKIAQEILDSDETLAIEINHTAEEIDGIEKQASLIDPGQRMVCVKPIQGLFHGRVYTAGEYVQPGWIMVLEDNGAPVGTFAADRFLPDWNGY